MRRFSAILLAGLACLGAAPATSWAEEGGAKHVVIVRTTADGSQRTRADVQTAPVGGPNLTSENVAVAAATNCTGCRSGAAAFQGIFVTGQPTVASPKNGAVATTGGCSHCFVFAAAYQYVVDAPGPVHLSLAGQAATKDLQEEASTTLESLSKAQGVEDLQQLQTEMDCIFWRGSTNPHRPAHPTDDECGTNKPGLAAVIDSELVEAGYHVTGTLHKQVKMSAVPGTSDTTTSDQTPTTTGDQTSGSSGTDTSGTGTSDSSGTDTSGSSDSGDTSGTDTSGSSGGGDTSGTSGTDQTSSGTATSGP